MFEKSDAKIKAWSINLTISDLCNKKGLIKVILSRISGGSEFGRTNWICPTNIQFDRQSFEFYFRIFYFRIVRDWLTDWVILKSNGDEKKENTPVGRVPRRICMWNASFLLSLSSFLAVLDSTCSCGSLWESIEYGPLMNELLFGRSEQWFTVNSWIAKFDLFNYLESICNFRNCIEDAYGPVRGLNDHDCQLNPI